MERLGWSSRKWPSRFCTALRVKAPLKRAQGQGMIFNGNSMTVATAQWPLYLKRDKCTKVLILRINMKMRNTAYVEHLTVRNGDGTQHKYSPVLNKSRWSSYLEESSNSYKDETGVDCYAVVRSSGCK